MNILKILSVVTVLSFTSAPGDGWKKDMRKMAEKECRMLEAKLKYNQNPADTLYKIEYDKRTEELRSFSLELEKKYQNLNDHDLVKKAQNLYYEEIAKCTAGRELYQWQEKQDSAYEKVKEQLQEAEMVMDSVLQELENPAEKLPQTELEKDIKIIADLDCDYRTARVKHLKKRNDPSLKAAYDKAWKALYTRAEQMEEKYRNSKGLDKVAEAMYARYMKDCPIYQESIQMDREYGNEHHIEKKGRK